MANHSVILQPVSEAHVKSHNLKTERLVFLVFLTAFAWKVSGINLLLLQMKKIRGLYSTVYLLS